MAPGSQATAAKAGAKPASSKRKAADAEPAEETENLKIAKASDSVCKSQRRHYFNRLASGQAKRANGSEVEQAQEAVRTYDALEELDKVKFAKAFYNNKGAKTFGFIKDYSEKISAHKKLTQAMEENYFTRTTWENHGKGYFMRNCFSSSQRMRLKLIYSKLSMYVYICPCH